jgi:hypothetical protein
MEITSALDRWMNLTAPAQPAQAPANTATPPTTAGLPLTSAPRRKAAEMQKALADGSYRVEPTQVAIALIDSTRKQISRRMAILAAFVYHDSHNET